MIGASMRWQEYWTTWVVGVSGVRFDDITSIEKEEKLFRQMGLPGFITCMDNVHFVWECTPYQVRWKYKDDTTIFAGVTNDKNIVLCDKLVSKMCDDPLFLERTCPTTMSVDGPTAITERLLYDDRLLELVDIVVSFDDSLPGEIQ
jgi:hypothetical protein